MTRISRMLFFWLPRFHNKTPIIQAVMHIMIGVSAIGIAASAVFFISRDIHRRVADTHERLLLLGAAQERQTLFTNLINDYKRLMPIFPALDAVIPRPEDVIMFADTLQTAAKETGNMIAFQFESSEPSADPVFADIAHVRFHAKVEGTGESFSQFLKRLETLRYLHSIDAITIEGEKGIDGSVSVLIKGILFIKKSD